MAEEIIYTVTDSGGVVSNISTNVGFTVPTAINYLTTAASGNLPMRTGGIFGAPNSYVNGAVTGLAIDSIVAGRINSIFMGQPSLSVSQAATAAYNFVNNAIINPMTDQIDQWLNSVANGVNSAVTVNMATTVRPATKVSHSVSMKTTPSAIANISKSANTSSAKSVNAASTVRSSLPVNSGGVFARTARRTSTKR